MTILYFRKYEQIDKESKKIFIEKMIKKYSKYMDIAIKSKYTNEIKNSMHDESVESSLEILINKYPENENYINKADVELIFPGHIRSYYASSEF